MGITALFLCAGLQTRSAACQAHTRCRGPHSAPETTMSTSQHPGPVNVTSFGDKIFADVIKDLQIRSSWIQGVP